MNEKNKIKAFGLVALVGGVATGCCLLAAVLGDSTGLWLTIACANVGYGSVFGIIALSKSKHIKTNSNGSAQQAQES